MNEILTGLALVASVPAVGAESGLRGPLPAELHAPVNSRIKGRIMSNVLR
jgi:hypothetical protein